MSMTDRTLKKGERTGRNSKLDRNPNNLCQKSPRNPGKMNKVPQDTELKADD